MEPFHQHSCSFIPHRAPLPNLGFLFSQLLESDGCSTRNGLRTEHPNATKVSTRPSFNLFLLLPAHSCWHLAAGCSVVWLLTCVCVCPLRFNTPELSLCQTRLSISESLTVPRTVPTTVRGGLSNTAKVFTPSPKLVFILTSADYLDLIS